MARYPISRGRWPTWAWLRPSRRSAICIGSVSATMTMVRSRRDPLAVTLGDLTVGLIHELRPAAGRDESREVREARQHVVHLLDGEHEVVVGVERAAGNLGPPSGAFEAFSRRRRRLAPRQSVADPLHALVEVLRRGPARLNAERAAVGRQSLQRARHLDAELAVLGADVGRSQVAVLGQEIRVPGDDRNARLAGALERARHRRSVRRRHGDAVDAARHEVLDDLDLLFLGVLARTGVEALDVRKLGLRRLAAVAGLVEERVVHRLGNQGERLLLIVAAAAAGRELPRPTRSQGALSSSAPPAKPLDHHRQDDERSHERPLPPRIDAGEQ